MKILALLVLVAVSTFLVSGQDTTDAPSDSSSGKSVRAPSTDAATEAPATTADAATEAPATTAAATTAAPTTKTSKTKFITKRRKIQCHLTFVRLLANSQERSHILHPFLKPS
ncbi:uncharacterized protein LOC106557890 isoform X2 [Canis lupus familiaris]|uniref:uncharacterized protein LOC106557890 isoform X2 n=1 Tax=Canis lupus familiaris TaxID=9615 RepID=UPI0018F7B05B|nr:uncharacterized protein LOC106557890 isoform X2 [Canis lupus familiaris]